MALDMGTLKSVRNSIFKHGFIFGIIILFVGMSFIPSAGSVDFNFSGNILYVGGNGPGNYTRIQDAIDASGDGDTVFVYDDSLPYYENIEVYKSINLIGEDRNTTMVDGGGSNNVIYISSDWVNISGFTIQNSGSDSTDAGIYVNSNNCMIFGNIIFNNFFGIYQFHSKNNSIFRNNVINNNNCGIVLASSSSTIIFENYVKGQPFNGIGLSQGSKNNIVSGNTIINNNYSGFRIIGSLDNTISGNNLVNNEIGVRLEYSSNNKIISNNFLENRQRIALFFGKNISHCRNTWDENYWDESRILPKAIFGRMNVLPWINFDWNPAKEPI
jgi:parallel beta-helix repeat protein